MINIDLDSKGRITEGTIQVRGDEETITNEIYAILTTLFKECLVSFGTAVDKHTLDMMEELEE